MRLPNIVSSYLPQIKNNSNGHFKMMRNLLIASAASVGLLLSACDSAEILAQQDGISPVGPITTDPTDPANPADGLDLIATAEAAGNFTQLLAALESAGLSDTLANPNNINTVFAPSDSAFDALGADAATALMADTAVLSDTLLYHVLSGSNDSAALTALAGTSVQMLNGSDAAITLDADQLPLINGVSISTTDITASNGIIHVIDAVLTPPDGAADPTTEATANIAQLVSDDPQFSTLLTALSIAGLDATLAGDGAFTVFAPTNDAFSAVGDESLNVLLADQDALTTVLLNHVVDGEIITSVDAIAQDGQSLTSAAGLPLTVTLDREDLKINNATIIQADIAATNGVVHAIDTVLLPAAAPAPGTIVDVLKANPDYSALVSLVTQANLVDTLNNVGEEFTVFAPNNAALTAAGPALEAGFTSDNAALANLLLGHVHAATLTAADVIALDGTDLIMVSGSQPITVTGGVVNIGGASVIDPDMTAQNGVIHGIDGVFLP